MGEIRNYMEFIIPKKIESPHDSLGLGEKQFKPEFSPWPSMSQHALEPLSPDLVEQIRHFLEVHAPLCSFRRRLHGCCARQDAQGEMLPVEECSEKSIFCGKVDAEWGNLLRCSKCKVVWYCSKVMVRPYHTSHDDRRQRHTTYKAPLTH